MYITNELLKERNSFLCNRNYTTNTILNYTSDIKLFLNYIKLEKQGHTVEENEITMKQIEKRTTYLSQVKTPKNSIYYSVNSTLSRSTIQSKITAIKSFLKFMNVIYDKGIDYRKIETKRIKSDRIECLTENEFINLKNFIGNYEKYKINALRMQLLCNIGYTSGLRLSEMLGLTVDEIRKRETRITGKGKKTRRVFFTQSTLDLLDEYMEERDKPIPRTGIKESGSDFVFISHNSGYDYGLPIKKNTVCEKMKKYSDLMDIGKRITCHALRHSYATKLLESGMNIREIQELLGHCDVQTTEGYCHVLKSNLSEKVSQIFD